MLVEPLERLKGLSLFTKCFGIYFVLVLFLLYCSTVNEVQNSSFIVPTLVAADNTKQVQNKSFIVPTLVAADNTKQVQNSPSISPSLVAADNTKRLSFLCHETFNKSLEDNLKVIQNYPRGVADNFLWKIGVNRSKPLRIKKFPVFATAINKKYYPQSQGLFQSLHRRFLANPKYGKDVHIIVYDLGLTGIQLEIVMKLCKCEVRRFPFDQFPPHVKELHTYAFKPIIVQQLLMEFGFVWWMDSSIRFLTDNIDSAVRYAKQYSMLYTVSKSNREKISLTKQTDKRTFEYLGEDRCKFRPFGETWATTVMFHYDRLSRAVVQAWVTCALNSDCIAPIGSLKKLKCRYELTFDGRCHRFDQSALSIITRRLFHEQNAYPLDITLNDIYVIKRGHIVSYFKS